MNKICLLLLFASLRCLAASEEVISSFKSGSASSGNIPFLIGNQVVVEDNWNSYMTLNNPAYQNLFSIKDNKVIVRLRYDDSYLYDPGYSWTLTVYYHTEFTDLSGNVTTTPSGTYSLEINYLQHSAPSNYTDISLNTHTSSGSYKVKVVIDNLVFTPASSSSQNFIPLTFEDIYLDVIESTERYYKLGNATAVISAQTGFNITNMQGDANLRLPLAWTSVLGAESYDLEWLYMDAGNNNFYPSNGYDFNFKNATRVNTLFNHYEIPLAYSAGIILFRVRPVGYDYNSTSGDVTRREGVWSFFSSGHGNTTADAPFVSQNFRYDFAGLDPDKNWLYKSSFMEEGKRKEMILYSDEALKDRQLSVYASTSDKVIIAEPVYDYEGRIAIDIIPTPTTCTGMTYYSFNPNYNPVDFDADVTSGNPNAYSAASGAGYYYSSNNPGAGLYGEHVPNAQDYPYIRTRYTTDGTGRIKNKFFEGVNHKPGSGHGVTYVYAKPNQTELDRLFGNEAGYSNYYSKTGAIDENGQSQVTYYDNQKRVIATCLAGDAPPNLLDLDKKPPLTPLTVDILLAAGNATNSSNQLVSSQQLPVLAPTSYHFDYGLRPDQFCKNCPNFSLCEDCVYDLKILITDDNGSPVALNNFSNFQSTPSVPLSNPIVYLGFTQVNLSFDLSLLPGTYAIDKILEVNETHANGITAQYIDNQILNPTCFTYPQIIPQPCDVSCRSACEERYMRYDFTVNQSYYVDDNENVISANQATVLIQGCEQTCENPRLPPEADYCALQLIALKKDMGPGGQYFSNTMAQFTIDPVNGVVNNPFYPAHEFDWLNTNLSSQASTIFSTLSGIANLQIASWADVKNHFQEAFFDELVKYHPEYCAYSYFCNGSISCGKGTSTPPISIFNSNTFDNNINFTSEADAISHGYFNTIALSVSNSHATSDFLNGNQSYCPYAASSNAADADPFVSFNCAPTNTRCSTTTGNYLLEQLRKYMSLGNGNYFSIWYVMDDPDDIHLLAAASSTTPPQSIIDLFKQLHGDGTVSNPGLFASLSKWEFYRSAYLFYKQLFIYDNYSQYSCPAPSVKNPLAPMPSSIAINHSQPTIHFPANVIFNSIILNTPICNSINGSQAIVSTLTTAINNRVASTCSANCTQTADSWIDQLSGCNLNATVLSNIRFYLIEVCKKECNATNIQGGSGCDINLNPNCQGVPGPGSTLFYNFGDVINHFTNNSCQVTIVHPPNNSDAGCSCSNLQAFITEHNLSISNPTLIATTLNNAFSNSTAYTYTDVTNWLAVCNQPNATMSDLASAGYPDAMRCNSARAAYNDTTCSCTKITTFINFIGYDASDSLDMPYIIAAINNYFALPASQQINATQLATVLADCILGQPQFTQNNIPPELLCPVPASNNSADIEAAIELADCQMQNLLSATSMAMQLFNYFIDLHGKQFKEDYIRHCLNKAQSIGESFTEVYDLKEYMFTLYYYDQAGNLVKTIPPEGFQELNPADFQAVADYRAGVPGSQPHYPDHRMVSRHSYDSDENRLDYESPDQDTIHYWYDYQGRMILSQTATQRNNQVPSPAYTYMEYDPLGRIVQTKQIYNIGNRITYDEATATASLNAWLMNTVLESQVTRLFYDVQQLSFNNYNPFGTTGQQHLRNRLSHITYVEVSVGNPQLFDFGSHYSYNEHGIPQTVSHENHYRDGNQNVIFNANEHFFTTDYDYDLISGKINSTAYQSGKIDALYHRFEYDADNRLTAVYSSVDNNIWENDGRYFYYDFGPLARKELGDKHIQGCDYAYTIRRWLKGMNSSILSTSTDIGQDGNSLLTSNLNSHFATDAFGYTQGYFKDDYLPVNPPPNSFESNVFGIPNVFGDYIHNTTSNPHNYGLYNGNISYCVLNSGTPSGNHMGVYGKAYRYDQAYRLKKHNTFSDPLVHIGNAWSSPAVDNNTSEKFAYDLNGNIDSVERKILGVDMDELSYSYLNASGFLVNNKLYGINDNASISAYFTDDIDNQASLDPASSSNPDLDPAINYGYNEDGQLYKDKSTGIQSIEYNIAGKIKRITRDPAFQLSTGGYLSDLEYFYDAFGRRVLKVEKPRIANGPQSTLAPTDQWKYTVYAYDGGDDVKAIYTLQKNMSNGQMELKISERYVNAYGRVAQINRENLLSETPSVAHFERELGLKTFELTNNMESINTTVLDYKASGNTSGTTVNYYSPAVLSAMDYLAYGTAIPGRKFISSTYRYGVNGGSEKDEEVMALDNMYSTYYRELDARSGRWWSTDPVVKAGESPYMVNNDNPINVADPMGDDPPYQSGNGNKDGLKAKFSFKKDGEGIWHACLGLSYRSQHVSPSVNIFLRRYKDDPATEETEKEIQYQLEITPALTFGAGQGPPTELNLHNRFSLSGVDNEYANSITIGNTFIMNKQHTHSETAIAFRAKQFNLTVYKDLHEIFTNKERWWAADYKLAFNTAGTSLSKYKIITADINVKKKQRVDTDKSPASEIGLERKDGELYFLTANPQHIIGTIFFNIPGFTKGTHHLWMQKYDRYKLFKHSTRTTRWKVFAK